MAERRTETPYTLRPISEPEARAISGWRYPAPYATYNGDPSSVASLLEPRYAYHAVVDASDELVGYFCFGEDATVPDGRRLGLYDETALDVGLGMRPDLTGRGLGAAFVLAGLRFAAGRYAPPAFRLTVVASNRRAVKVYERVGFEVARSFGAGRSGWLLMRRPALGADG